MTDSSSAYEKHAQAFLNKRDRSAIGTRTVEQWCGALNNKAAVLELGCGAGYPVTRVLDNAGLSLWCIDSSASLLAEFERRFPHIPVQCSTVQSTDFFDKKFDAIIAIGLVFLLSETDQQNLMKRVSAALLPGGKFLFTAPIEIGTWTDTNTGIKCTSPGYQWYVTQLNDAGLNLRATCSDSGKNNYYDTERLA